MLDPRDVRVGNWVIKITGTDKNTKSFFEYKPIALDEYYYTFAKVCFPIKLSAVNLEGCGFTYQPGEWFINMEDNEKKMLPLRFEHATKSWWLGDLKILAQPKYLHQLQNLFYALSKKELIIQSGNFENIAISEPVNFFIKPLMRTTVASEAF